MVIIAVAALGLAIYVAWRNYDEHWLEESQRFREEVAGRLKSHWWPTIYCASLKAALDWLDHPNRMGALSTSRGILQCFNMSMAIAASYGVASLIAGWTLGGPGAVGKTNFLPDNSYLFRVLLGVVLIVLSLVVSVGLRRGKEIDAMCESHGALITFLYRVSGAAIVGIIYLAVGLYGGLSGAITVGVSITGATGVVSALAGTVVGALSIAFAVGGGVAIGGVVTGAVLGVFALSMGGVVVLPGLGAAIFAATVTPASGLAAGLIFAGAPAEVVSLALCGAVAVTGLVTVALLRGNGFMSGSIVGTIGGATAAAGTVAVAMLTHDPGNSFAVALLLFSIILPFINAIMDWLSWLVSRKLGRFVLSIVSNDTISRHLKLLYLAAHMIVDIVVAIILLLLLVGALSFVLEIFNMWCRYDKLVEPLPLRPFIDQVIKKPIPDGIWVLTMLCSTLVPTAIHAMILLASPVTVWLRSDSRREDIADGLVATPPRDGAIREASRHLMEARLIGFIAFAAFMIIFLTAIRALLGPVSIIIVKLADCGMAAASKVAVAFGWT